MLSYQAHADFKDRLSRTEAGKAVLSLNPKILTDEIRDQIAGGSYRRVFGRTPEALDGIKTLIRIKGKNPVFLGEAGVGKTEVVRMIAEMIARGKIPDTALFAQEILNSEIIQIDPSAISNLAKKPADSARLLVAYLRKIEQETNKNVILFIDEIHSLDSDIWDALKPALDSADGIKLIGASTQREFSLLIGNDEALVRRLQPIGVSEFSEKTTSDILKKSWQSVIERRYSVQLQDGVIEKIVSVYKKVLPDVSRPDGPLKFLTDLAIVTHTKKESLIEINDVFDFIKTKTKLPADPRNLEEIDTYIRAKSKILKSKILGQDQMIDQVLKLYRNLLLGNGDSPEVAILMGPTGVGKTYLGELVAEVLFEDNSKFFKIDGAAFSDRSSSLNGLLGAKPGTVGSNQTVGTLVEFFTNPGKGKFGGVLLIDEIEKMHPETLKEIGMALFDKGEITPGKGKRIRVPNLLILATTNHGMSQIFPAGFEKWSEREVDDKVNGMSQRDLKDLFANPTDAKNDYTLPKELINRIGSYILTKPLSLDTATSIAKMLAQDQMQIFKERNGIRIELSDEVIRFLTEQTFNKEDGVRDLLRAVRSFLNDVTGSTNEKNISVSLRKEGARKSWYFTVKTPNGTNDLKNNFFKSGEQGLSDDDLNDLKKLTAEVKKEIIGQDEMVDKAIAAIRNWQLFPTNKPLVILAVGTTATGKTETAKVLAKAWRGSDQKSPIVSLGDIRRKEDLTKIFGANPQYIKSDQMGLLEKAIIQVKDGGILILDEISNMCSESPQSKEECLFSFYNAFEEGFWPSPNTGRRYDLSKIIFWMTGNDLQEFYQGVTSDDMRLSIYNGLKNEQTVRSELRKKGFSEAFLRRCALVVHTKPLLNLDRIGIAKKMMDNALSSIRNRFPGIEVHTPPLLYKQMSDAFFDPGQGAGSLKSKFESEVKSIIAQVLLESGTNDDTAGNRVIDIKIVDKRSSKPYAITGLVEQFYIQINLYDKNYREKVIGSATNNLLENIDTSKPDPKELIKVSFHEIGHAFLTDPKTTGQRLRFVTITPGSTGEHKYLGYAAYDSLGTKITKGVSELKASLLRIVGGRVAQEFFGFEPDTGWTSDYEKMNKLIGKYYVTAGLKKELWGTKFNDKTGELIGTEKQKDFFAELVQNEIEEAMALAEKKISESKSLVRFLVAQLVRKQSLTGEEFETLIKFFKNQELTVQEQTLMKKQFSRLNLNNRNGLPNTSGSVSAISEVRTCEFAFEKSK